MIRRMDGRIPTISELRDHLRYRVVATACDAECGHEENESAHERMERATTDQLRAAVTAHREGHDVGLFLPAVLQFLRLTDAA